MRKLFFVALLGLLSFTAQAQRGYMTSDGNGYTADTVTNAGTETFTADLWGKGVVSIQVVATKISGTAAGSVVLQGSLNGVAYATVSSDTLTLANVSTAQSKIWTFSGAPYRYYRIQVIGSGTQSLQVKGYYTARN